MGGIPSIQRPDMHFQTIASVVKFVVYLVINYKLLIILLSLPWQVTAWWSGCKPRAELCGYTITKTESLLGVLTPNSNTCIVLSPTTLVDNNNVTHYCRSERYAFSQPCMAPALPDYSMEPYWTVKSRGAYSLLAVTQYSPADQQHSAIQLCSNTRITGLLRRYLTLRNQDCWKLVPIQLGGQTTSDHVNKLQ